ncbi:MAG: substrate-binding domain-containing protein, partial [Crocinitomicaceae bacterium]|nr:substrate-binding domain-containing protein [Crocinitomicaceae bacterium]
RLVLGENISQAAQFITTGAADIGIIALSLALSPTMKKEGKYYIIPEDSHHPLLQGSIITTHARGNLLAATFHEFMESKQAIDILHYFGLSEP